MKSSLSILQQITCGDVLVHNIITIVCMYMYVQSIIIDILHVVVTVLRDVTYCKQCHGKRRAIVLWDFLCIKRSV